MRLVPVALRIENAAPDSWARISFSTPNAEWSLGAAGRDGLGLSCNYLDLLRPRESIFQCLEILGPSLAFKTAPNSSGDPFVFSLMVSVPDNVDLVEAHCDFNDDAVVYAEFENLMPQVWNCGRVSAQLPPVLPDIKKINLCVRGAQFGELVRVSLKAESDSQWMLWSFGASANLARVADETLGLLQPCSVRTELGQPLPLARLTMSENDIDLELAPAAGAYGVGNPGVLMIGAFVACMGAGGLAAAGSPGRLLLRAQCNDDVLVTAQCGYQRPQYLTSVYKPFDF